MLSKKSVISEVISSSKLATGVYELWLKTELAGEAKPGCFIGIYPHNKATLLPRPISICEADGEKNLLRVVYRVVGSGTEEFSDYRPGQKVRILGILGNGYQTQNLEGKRVLLMGGGIGIPPMLELAKNLKNSQVTVTLGYRNQELFLKEEFEKLGSTYVATEDGSYGTKGNVMDIVVREKLNADIICACGPMPMLKAIKRFSLEKQIPAYISLEERMACGVGACLGCVCKTTKPDAHSQVNNARICTDGPVFLAEDVAVLEEDRIMEE